MLLVGGTAALQANSVILINPTSMSQQTVQIISANTLVDTQPITVRDVSNYLYQYNLTTGDNAISVTPLGEFRRGGQGRRGSAEPNRAWRNICRPISRPTPRR
ncbi:MAG: hypothetical protein WDN04_18135 [Rhodospirillales bacterium]